MKTELIEKSLKTLELPAIKELLANEAVSPIAKETALALSPCTDLHEVQALLDETDAAKKMMELKSAPAFSGVTDIRASVKRADMGGMLNTRELLDIASLLRTALGAITYASSDNNEKSAIDYLFAALRANKHLETKISNAIIAEDEIADNASPALYDIRRYIRIAGDKVRQALNKIISSPAYSKSLQEPIVTMRNDRYVVPVKAEHKSSVPGLVHDISSSGATLFIEPMSVVTLNNEIRELVSKEKKEIERILMELSADVATVREDLLTDFETLCALDLIFAKAKLSYKLNATAPELSSGTTIKLKKARHPLLDKNKAVPIDVSVGSEYDTLIITGPNTGGKTVTLKTLGLFCAMTQCGLHIPASDGSTLPVLDFVLADIGDEQSIGQSLSTFSSHMTNIVKILEQSRKNTLLLFDELGAGTDPVEGAALAIAIIEYARNSGALVAATTHYAELKTYALTTPKVLNASCEFDVETLRPTFRLIAGIPGKSNAFAISQRLGLCQSIIEDAKHRVNAENTSFEEVLENLEKKRMQLEADNIQIGKLKREAEENARIAEKYKEELEREREKAQIIARREALQIINEARSTADSVISELTRIRKLAASEDQQHQINTEKSELFRRLNEAENSMHTSTDTEPLPEPTRKIKAGDRVRLIALGTDADVIELRADGTLVLRAGVMSVTVQEDEVRLIEGESTQNIKKYLQKSEAKLREMTVKPELDLRGLMTDEAVMVLERFIDNAHLSKLETVTIIHGKGTGAVRKAVHDCLKREPLVKSYRLGRYGEGESGVTIAVLK